MKYSLTWYCGPCDNEWTDEADTLCSDQCPCCGRVVSLPDSVVTTSNGHEVAFGYREVERMFRAQEFAKALATETAEKL